MTEKQKAPAIGDLGKDRVTGFTGVVTATAQHITGCDTVYLTPKVDKDGKHGDGGWYDVHRVDVVEAGHVKLPNTENGQVGAMDLPAPR